jgi:hypothetical protein
MKPTDDIYVSLSRPIDAGTDRQYDTLQLSVIHRQAGIDLRGKPYQAGHAITFTPCALRDGWMTSTLFGRDQWTSGILMRLDDRPRKNPHYITRAMRVLDEMKQHIADAFIARDGIALANIAALIHARSVKTPARPEA